MDSPMIQVFTEKLNYLDKNKVSEESDILDVAEMNVSAFNLSSLIDTYTDEIIKIRDKVDRYAERYEYLLRQYSARRVKEGIEKYPIVLTPFYDGNRYFVIVVSNDKSVYVKRI